MAEGIAQLKEVQQKDPKLPHTWFNLGIQYKKAGETEQAIAQFEQMAKLAADEPIVHYQLGTLYKIQGRVADARAQFESAAKLNPDGFLLVALSNRTSLSNRAPTILALYFQQHE